MAAFEDFDFFRSATATLAPPPPPRSARAERDALRAELERIHAEMTRLRTHARRSSWARMLRRLVTRLGR